MRVLLVSGIWPPDVGGPASHGPELASFLLRRGHEVRVVTTAEAPPAREPYDVVWVSRRYPVGIRHAASAAAIARVAATSDVVYATGMVGRAACGCVLVRRPLVVKLTTDEAFERALRRGLFAGDLDEFQRSPGGPAVAALRLARTWALRRAARVVCPSSYLRALAVAWGLDPARVAVVPNPAPALPPLPERHAARAALGANGPVLAFAGRLGRQKAVETALEAIARVEGVSLLLAGDGPERALLERRAAELGLGARARFLGPKPREQVLALFRAADATLLPSTWENFPHTVVESLAVGTPVIATRVGGVPEVVEDGVNGLLVPAGDADALASAIRRLLGEPGLRERLAAAAAPSVAGLAADEVYARIETLLSEAAAG